MKIIRGFKVRGFILAGAFFAGLSFGTSASAQWSCLYSIDLNSKTVTDFGFPAVFTEGPAPSTTPGRWWVRLWRGRG